MKNLRQRGVAVVTAMTFAALIGTGAASATTLEIGGAAQNQAVSIEASLASGTSIIWKDKNGVTDDTCTGSTIKFTTESPFSGASVGGKVATLTFTGCSHTTHVLKSGSLSVSWTSATNGTISSSGTEVTTKSTIFGITEVCTTGAGTTIGTLTGVGTGHATIDINATTLSCLGTATWTGTYTATSPTGLGVVS